MLDKLKPPSSRPRLFRATFKGERQEVGHAEVEELSSLNKSLAGETIRDTLICWSLVALRWEDDRPSEIHALGWRSLTMQMWITSSITALDWTARMIRTHSGKIYRLGDADHDGISPGLLSHLTYALRTWGYDSIEP